MSIWSNFFSEAAKKVDETGRLAAQVDRINTVLQVVVHMLYKKESDGGFANLDSTTHRIRPSMPWGRAGWKDWGLRQWEGELLRDALQARSVKQWENALFFYDEGTHQWFLSISQYPTHEDAKRYLNGNLITLSEWRMRVEAWRECQASRKRVAAAAARALNKPKRKRTRKKLTKGAKEEGGKTT